jgi:hypothetical protein
LVTGRGVHDDGVRCFIADLVARERRERSDWIISETGNQKLFLLSRKGVERSRKGRVPGIFCFSVRCPKKIQGRGWQRKMFALRKRP